MCNSNLGQIIVGVVALMGLSTASPMSNRWSYIWCLPRPGYGVGTHERYGEPLLTQLGLLGLGVRTPPIIT